jgi:hypothetical protein
MTTADIDPVNQIKRFRGCLLGLAAGDAVGTLDWGISPFPY